MPSTTVSPSRRGSLVTTPSNGRYGARQVKHVLVAAEVGDLGLQMAAGGIGLRLGLVELGDGLGHGGDVQIVGCLLGVVVLLGHDAVFVESLGAVPVQLFLFQVGLGVVDVGFLRFFRGNIGGNVGLGGGNGGLLAVDCGFLLDVLDGRYDLALLSRCSPSLTLRCVMRPMAVAPRLT